LLSFYRRELSAAGWIDTSDATVVSANQATLLFAIFDDDKGPAGILELKLNQTATDESEITITQKNPAKAEAVGILPPTGQARLFFINLNETEVTFTINQQEYKVAPDFNTEEDPVTVEGPFVDLAPGTYSVTLSLPSGETFSEEITVGAEEAWALAALGGILPLRAY